MRPTAKLSILQSHTSRKRSLLTLSFFVLTMTAIAQTTLEESKKWFSQNLVGHVTTIKIGSLENEKRIDAIIFVGGSMRIETSTRLTLPGTKTRPEIESARVEAYEFQLGKLDSMRLKVSKSEASGVRLWIVAAKSEVIRKRTQFLNGKQAARSEEVDSFPINLADETVAEETKAVFEQAIKLSFGISK
ncbi:MAG: hypothetical protein ABMA26_06325 [Limisphaerales bacterium]